MCPMYDYQCHDCREVHEAIVGRTADVSIIQCPKCGGVASRQPVVIGGYSGNMGGASTRPKNAGSFKREKKGKK